MAITKKKIIFTVTTDLSFDQRMQRICGSLSAAGFQVLLVGRKTKKSVSLLPQPYGQKRLYCFFEKGILFYVVYNIRLFFFLLSKKADCICAIDLDSILPCYFVSTLKNTKRVYDAHELFCEMKEIVTRPPIHSIWKKIEQFAVPKFSDGYTVNQPIADEFKKMYGVNYKVIRNVAKLTPLINEQRNEKILLYQGAVNEGRCFETLIPAMQEVDAILMICGDGNFMTQIKLLVAKRKLENKIIFKGNIVPDELRTLTEQAYIGINLVENNGLSNYLSLANKFFDYMQACLPQLCISFPAYKKLNDEFGFAVLIEEVSAKNIAAQLNNLLENKVLYSSLQRNCIVAREKLNWQEEEKLLILFYNKLFEEAS